MKNILIVVVFILVSGVSQAANQGKITSIAFAGKNMSIHPDVVQLMIEGGFSFGACNSSIAAIRKGDEHLISAALSAYAMGKSITVWINQNDSYYPSQNRCVITMITLEE